MAINAAKNVTDLDFESIRTNLQTYLESQDQFKDYDFNGSGLSILLDVLSYNTHYSSFYANMVANEMFIDSAVKRESVVSHAKQIGYTPHSVKSAEAKVTLSFSAADADTILVPSLTQFTAEIDSVEYTFYNTSPITIGATGDAPYVSSEFSIYEGSWNNVSYVASSSASTKYLIPSENVDTDHLFVRVLESTTDTTGANTIWSKSNDITGVTSGSTVYFLEETPQGLYEIKFGDNIVGKKVEDGNVVLIEYLSTSGAASNGVGRNDSSSNRTFTTTLSNCTVIVSSSANGGSARESIESIRENAPLFYQTQDRAVTKNDYKSLTLSEYGNADDVLVYGGEDYDPPQYGKVFVSIKPSSGGILTEDQKQDILKDIYKTKSVVGVIPEIIDPEYSYLKFDAKFDYDSSLTLKSEPELRSLILVYLGLYANENLSKFGKNLYVNKLEELCRGLDPSLLYVDVDVQIEKRIAPTLNKKQNYIINYQNTISNTSHDSLDGENGPPSIQSTLFAYAKTDGTVFLAGIDSDMNGKLRIYETQNNERVTIFDDIGSINFEKGLITINDLIPLSATKDGTIRFTVTPREDVIQTRNNNILSFDNASENAILVARKDSTMISTNRVERTARSSQGSTSTTSTSTSTSISSSSSSSSSFSSGY